jgi:hypothetical protein
VDLDPDRGIAAGERWERSLNEAARRCEAVLFLISMAWLGSAQERAEPRAPAQQATVRHRSSRRALAIGYLPGPQAEVT